MDDCGIWISAPPRGVLTISSQDFDGNAGGGEMDPSSDAGRRIGGAVVLASMAVLTATNSLLVAACPVLHEHVEVGVTLSLDDRVPQRLVGGVVALELEDTELGRRAVIIQIFALYTVSSERVAARTRRR